MVVAVIGTFPLHAMAPYWEITSCAEHVHWPKMHQATSRIPAIDLDRLEVHLVMLSDATLDIVVEVGEVEERHLIHGIPLKGSAVLDAEKGGDEGRIAGIPRLEQCHEPVGYLLRATSWWGTNRLPRDDHGRDGWCGSAVR